jgi:hypothetical protein
LKTSLSRLYFAAPICLLGVLVFLHLFGPSNWSYDRFGAATSHVELDDLTFRNEYLKYANQLGIRSAWAHSLFVQVLLPIFVVPIRWTYALGTSSWLEIARYVPFDWDLLRPLLLAPNVGLIFFGLYLIRKVVIRFYPQGRTIGYLAALTVASTPFVAWSISLSSYSHHIICFGLCLYTHAMPENPQKPKIFGRRSLARCLVPIFNYQYIPVIAFLGLFDLVKSKESFFTQRRFLSWLAPAFVCVGSTVFLYMRARLSGKHDNPTGEGAMSPLASLSFSRPFEAVEQVAIRYWDIAGFFFSGESVNHSTMPAWLVISALLMAITFIVLSLRNIARPLAEVIVVILGSTIVLHLSGILPMSPTRHQLLVYIPLCTLIALILSSIKRESWHLGLNLCAIFLAIFALRIQLNWNATLPPNIDYTRLTHELTSNRVEHLVLPPCFLEPTLNQKLRNAVDLIYRCGPKTIKTIPAGSKGVAILTGIPVEARVARYILSDYTQAPWVLRPMSIDASAGATLKSNVWLATHY